MADQESRGQSATVAVRNGATANGRVAKRDSDEIVAEIEQTRQNLARTIDTLADRVSPSSNIRRLREQVAEQAAKPGSACRRCCSARHRRHHHLPDLGTPSRLKSSAVPLIARSRLRGCCEYEHTATSSIL